METSLVIVSVTVGGGAVTVDEVHVLCVDDGPSAAVFRGDGRGRAAEVKTRFVALGVAETEWGREVPPLAGSQALDPLSVPVDS